MRRYDHLQVPRYRRVFWIVLIFVIVVLGARVVFNGIYGIHQIMSKTKGEDKTKPRAGAPHPRHARQADHMVFPQTTPNPNVQSEDRMDVGDIPKPQVSDRDMGDLMSKKEQFQRSLGSLHPAAQGQPPSARGENRSLRQEDVFFPDGIDWGLEEQMKARRVTFNQRVAEMYEEMDESQFKDMHESDEGFAYVTAASHTTYMATLEFVYSVQYFFPASRIGIYDIGLTEEERSFLKSLCHTTVESMWLQFWPDEMYNIRQRVWRPLLLQFALAKFGHFIYLEPGRFVNKQRMKPYLTHSRKHGVTVAGKQQPYSSFVVTSPHMYAFLKTDERKLQKTRHFDFTFLVLHNTKRVRNYFMRYLLSCAMEEYCIAPPGIKKKCDPFINNKRYSRCHKFDESAINLILNDWHQYRPEEYLAKDGVTKYFDGKDMTAKVRKCSSKAADEM